LLQNQGEYNWALAHTPCYESGHFLPPRKTLAHSNTFILVRHAPQQNKKIRREIQNPEMFETDPESFFTFGFWFLVYVLSVRSQSPPKPDDLEPQTLCNMRKAVSQK
jgi:hypothetical protein